MQSDNYHVCFTGHIGPARNGTHLFIREIMRTEALKAFLCAILLRVIMPAAANLIDCLNSETLEGLGAWLSQFSRVVCNCLIAFTVVNFFLEFDPDWKWIANPSYYIRLPDYKYSFDLELIISAEGIQLTTPP